MEIILQRGVNSFLIKLKEDLYMVNTVDKHYASVVSEDQVLRLGYCEDPNPSTDQKEILEQIAKEIEKR